MTDPPSLTWRPWLEVPAFLGLAVVCAALSNHVAGPSRRLSWGGSPAPRAVASAGGPVPSPDLLARFPPLADRPESEVDYEAAAWLHGHGALVLDARRSRAYAEGHLPGARSLSPWEDGLGDKIDRLALEVSDLKAPVLLYCAGGGCEDSHLLAQKLWLAGFRNLRLYAGGFPEWQAKGGPVAAGSAP